MSRYTSYEVASHPNYNQKIQWCKYSDVEQLEATNKAQAVEASRYKQLANKYKAKVANQKTEIDALKAHVERLILGINHYKEQTRPVSFVDGILSETPSQSLSTIKANAIREMIENTQCQDPAMRVVQDMLDYADDMEKE